MIRGLHGLFYSSDAAATRAFMRDVLRLPSTDVGDGWLIFDLPECDLGVHPTGGRDDGGTEPPPNTHDVSFFCDDIQGTVADLRARGVQFRQDPQDHGYGWVTHFTMPGGVEVQLYEPKYEKPGAAKPAAAKKPAAPKKPTPKKPAAKKPTAPKKAAAKKPAAAKQPAKQPAKKPAARKR